MKSIFRRLMKNKQVSKWKEDKVAIDRVMVGEREYVLYSPEKFYNGYPERRLESFKHSNCEIFQNGEFIETFFDLLRRYTKSRYPALTTDVVYNIRRFNGKIELMCFINHYTLNENGTEIVSHRNNR